MTTEDEIKEKIVRVLAEEFELEPSQLSPSATLYDDLGLDSLDGVDVVVVLEKTFGVKISDEDAIRNVRTVNDIFDLVIQFNKND